MGNKYIIEVEDIPFSNGSSDRLYRVKGFNSLVFDKTGIEKLTPYSTEDVMLDKILTAINNKDKNSEPCTNDVIEDPDAYTMKIKYHTELYPDIKPIEKHGNFIDLYTAEDINCKARHYVEISLGISVEVPNGYWFQLVPRSSTFKKYGIIQTNSFGVIDKSYCGDNDIIKMPVYCMNDVFIPANTRICQFRLVKDIDFCIKEVDTLNNEDRGGFGSTGEN